jgi:hypothetical protein
MVMSMADDGRRVISVSDEYWVVVDPVTGEPWAEPFTYTPLSREPEDCVYFIEGGGLVKIGLSNDFASRFAALCRMSPVPLTLRHRVMCDDKGSALKLERELHTRFASARHHGEWFTPTPELVAYIDSRATA